MKLSVISLLLILSVNIIQAQVGVGTNTPDNSAILEVKSTTKGFLIPRMTKESVYAINDPAPGLMAFCTNCCEGGAIAFYNGTNWISENIIADCIGCDTKIKEIDNFDSSFPASAVLAQSNFSSNTQITATDKLSTPGQIAYDSISGKIFVTEGSKNRVLRFASVEDFILNKAAEFVFGQPDFTTTTSGTSANNMSFPFRIQVDNLGNLWVGEWTNQRIIRFSNAANITTPLPNADLVLGQPNFIVGPGIFGTFNQSNFRYVRQFQFDENNDLWVVQNGSVLKFNNPNTLSNYAPADMMFGHNDWNSNDHPGGVAKGPTSLEWTYGMAIKNDTLYVSEGGNRIYRYYNASSKSTIGSAADDVFFQPNFSSVTSGTSDLKVNVPTFMKFVDNDLFIADRDNNRILVIKDANSKAANSPADYVIGQTNFTTSTAQPASETSIKGSISSAIKVPFNNDTLLLISEGGSARALAFNRKYFSIPELATTTKTILNAEITSGTLKSVSIQNATTAEGGTVTITNALTGECSIDLSSVNVTEDTLDSFKYRIINSEGCLVELTQNFIIKAL